MAAGRLAFASSCARALPDFSPSCVRAALRSNYALTKPTTKMKTLTAEQAAARDARREKFRALVKSVAAMSDEQRNALVMQAGAVVTCEGKALSMTNTMLLFLQLPGVSVVGGFRQWLKAGRCVRKGQHGGSIWIPLMAKGADAEPEASGESTDRRFGTATVFDISQTDEAVA